jgi:hypothetical protein
MMVDRRLTPPTPFQQGNLLQAVLLCPTIFSRSSGHYGGRLIGRFCWQLLSNASSRKLKAPIKMATGKYIAEPDKTVVMSSVQLRMIILTN